MKKSVAFPRLLRLSLSGAVLLLLAACHPDKKDDPQPVQPIVTKSVYVINEGSTNGAISLFSKETHAVQRDLFAAANSRQLGPFVQSMTAVGDKLYLVVNGANRIEVVNRSDFRSVAVIDSTSPALKLSQPRYFLAVGSDKAYLTEWRGNGSPYLRGRVSVLDLRTNKITKQIPVGVNPEQLLLTNNRLYVANSYGTTLSVIDPTTDVVVDSVTVPEGPKNLALDNAGNIWVLCSFYGGAQDHLVRFKPATPAAQTAIAFPNSYLNGNLHTTAAGDKLYISLSSGIYQLTPTTTSLPAAPLIPRNFYGLGVDPQDGTLYAGTGTFSSDSVIRYTPTGQRIDAFPVAIGPNGFMFY